MLITIVISIVVDTITHVTYLMCYCSTWNIDIVDREKGRLNTKDIISGQYYQSTR